MILFTEEGVCLSACWDTNPPRPGPSEQTPPRTRHPPTRHPSPWTRPPRSRHPPGPRTPPDHAPPRTMHPHPHSPPPDQAPPPQPPGPGTPLPRRRACWEIRSTSGRYASYWNAILFNYENLHFKMKLTQGEWFLKNVFLLTKIIKIEQRRFSLQWPVWLDLTRTRADWTKHRKT